MILVRVFGGLGNQLFQYAAAKALSLRNNVALKLDINSVINPDSHNRVFCLHYFNINTPIAGQEEIEKFLAPKRKYFIASRYILNKTGFGFHKSWWCHPELLPQPGRDGLDEGRQAARRVGEVGL